MRPISPIVALLISSALCPFGWAADGGVSGRLTDPQGKPVAGATVRLFEDSVPALSQTTSDAEGRFAFSAVPAGTCRVVASSTAFNDVTASLRVAGGQTLSIDLQFLHLAPRAETVTVTEDVEQVDLHHPDPAQRVNVRQDILDANPGRPGAPVSIPGVPIETASGGLKAPQYFAPGVAGDHGEPIAQFLQVGSFLLPNNLSANAHGNGYADPNIMVPAIIESVQTDGGAFNVREGDHSVALAATYGLRESLAPFVTVTGDRRDIDLVSGWSPSDPRTRAWVAVQASYGNGFLQTLEHRQQYKVNGFRVFDLGKHQLTIFGIGYYGQSRIPGLVPIDVPDLHDTIDPRQRDQTHTAVAALNDVWRPSSTSEFDLSGFFRTYNLSLYSDFGDGLIRQSEFRTVAGGNGAYIRRFNSYFSILSGVDYLREAPRRLDLDRYDSLDPSVYGPFSKVTANNVTLQFASPYFAIDGRLASWLHYNVGWRRDEIDFTNADLLAPANSYRKWVGVNSPKATIGIVPPEHSALPSVALSFGQAFFTNDPRIGSGTSPGTPVSRAHSYQMVIGKTLWSTELRVTLGRVTQEQSLAKIDADTGLQFNEGPSRNRYVTFAARRYFGAGMLQASFSKADARDLLEGAPLPEAPRLIVDFLGTLDRLPFHLHARAEYEEVGRKPLGDGFAGVPVRELRGALARRFGSRLEAGLNFLAASGYTGQTTESLALPFEAEAFERVVGVRAPSYVSLSFSYFLGRQGHP